MSLKVLPLEAWMRHLDWGAPELIKTQTVFGRDGYYLNGSQCWFEVNGEAYLYDSESFRYTLALHSHTPLRHAERDAITTLGTLAPRSLRELLQFDTEWLMIRDTYRMTMKGLLHVRRLRSV